MLDIIVGVLSIGIAIFKTYHIILWERLIKTNPDYKTDSQLMYDKFHTGFIVTFLMTGYTSYVVSIHQWTIGIILMWFYIIYSHSLWIYVRNHRHFNIEKIK